jgi:hypothetical protein
MPSGNWKLAEQVERLPLDDPFKTAVLEGVEHTDAATADREAESLKEFLDSLPQTLESIREAVARDRRRQAASVPVHSQATVIDRHASKINLAKTTVGGVKPSAPAVYAAICPTCGHANSGGLEQFLGRLGITDDMVNNLKGQFQNVEIDEYLNTARTYLKDGSGKVTTYAKENPGKVAAGVAAIAVGAGLIYAAFDRDRE